MTMYVEMPSFVSALEEMAAHGVDRAGVQSYLEQTPVAPASLDPYVWYRPDRYTRNGIHKSEPFEILVLCWGPGHKAPIHGHEGELCWARVERGRLRFVNYRLVSEQPLLLEPSGPPVDGAVQSAISMTWSGAKGGACVWPTIRLQRNRSRNAAGTTILALA
jgi:hypothetical protein